MPLFQPENRTRTAETRRVYALYEIAHTTVDFAAALCFLVGSILFLWRAYETPAVWLFILGALCFMAKPTLRLLREVQLYRMGKIDRLAQRETGS